MPDDFVPSSFCVALTQIKLLLVQDFHARKR